MIYGQTLTSSLGAASWRCPGCVSNGLEQDKVKPSPSSAACRRSSAHKIARDLLPAHRGAYKPDSYSIFSTLIPDDDPMDGSRQLRKRKSTSDPPDEVQRSASQKRRHLKSSSVLPVAQLGGETPGIEGGLARNSADDASLRQPRSTIPRHSRKKRKPLFPLSSMIRTFFLSRFA